MSVIALILDAHLKSSLAAIRSLGRQGVPIIAGSHRRTAMGLHSRYVVRRFVYPSPLADRSGFVAAVLGESKRAGKVLLLPFSDSTLLPLVAEQGFFGTVCIYPMPPDLDNFRIAFDKALTLQLAKTLGVEIPVTYFSSNETDLSVIAHELTFPAVIKARRSVSWTGNRGAQANTAYAFSESD